MKKYVNLNDALNPVMRRMLKENPYCFRLEVAKIVTKTYSRKELISASEKVEKLWKHFDIETYLNGDDSAFNSFYNLSSREKTLCFTIFLSRIDYIVMMDDSAGGIFRHMNMYLRVFSKLIECCNIIISMEPKRGDIKLGKEVENYKSGKTRKNKCN